jgi:catalase
MAAKRNSNSKIDAKSQDLQKDTLAPGEAMTTNQGLQVATDQDQLKAGVRGPSLLEDFHFREKITHFDHERIPERVVHARGAAAHGYFECTNAMTKFTKASIFSEKGKRTPVFLRFSTVAGSRGSADTPRDVRGFAIKFYTDQGVWDLVGNNIPVFFIQDAIKFPDLIHAVKPEPNNEIPQAASAHDTFYDFVSLTPETMHMIMWVMSDRGLPRSFATMQGFGIHTFRFINAKGQSSFVKFHFKPKKGVHSLVWDEAQKIAGKDADFNRRDLYEAINRGDFPEWEFGVQIVPEADEHKFDFDLLDPTKIIPEELVPVTPMGKLVLNRNPDNFFAETEQVAFHPGHIVPGIDFSNDPLLQGRLFSYIDTQIKRVGPNFAQIPINRPTCPFSNNQRDGESQQYIHLGRVAYSPNTLAGGCPVHTNEGIKAFSSFAEKMDGAKVRQRSPSFSDHFSQATLFWNSMADWEKKHIVDALSFELNMVQTVAIKQRFLDDLLANVADELVQRVADNIGMTVKTKSKIKKHNKTSPALSMDKPCDSIKGMKVAILCGEGVDGGQVAKIKSQLKAEGATFAVIARRAGVVETADGDEMPVDMPSPNAPSVIFDAVIVPENKADVEPLAKQFVAEQYAHAKTIAAIGNGTAVLAAAEIDVPDKLSKTTNDSGVVTGSDAAGVIKTFMQAMLMHRHFDRNVDANKGAPALIAPHEE